MKLNELRKIAAYWKVDAGTNRPKQDIIREIQVKEGNSPCFGTKETCENECLWKADCLKIDQR